MRNLNGNGTITANGGVLDLSGMVSNSAGNLTLAVNNSSTLEINNTATANNIALTNNTQTLEIASSGNLTLTGAENITNGNINIMMAGGQLSMYGNVNAAITNGNGTITANGGTLNLAGTITGGNLNLAINNGSTLEISNTANTLGVSINSSTQTLEIATTGHLTLNGAESITNGTINLAGAGATLTDNSGLTIGTGATLTGAGTVTVSSGTNTISGSGNIVANGGTLDLNANIGSGVSNLQIDSGATLEITGGVADVSDQVTFEGNGTLKLTSNNVSGNALGNFNGVIANMNVGNGVIDLSNISTGT